VSYGAKLADIHDAIHHFKDDQREVDYVVRCVRERAPHARTLLDVACGTGRHLSRLSGLFEIEGLDMSADMLERARGHLPAVPLHHAGMTDFDLGRQFDVVICLFASVAYVKTLENFRAAIRTMTRHLAPGGLLLVEPFFTPQTYWVDHLKLNEVNRPDLKIAWIYVSKREGTVGVLDIHYLVGRQSGVEHFVERHEMGLFSEQDYRDAFGEAGLTLHHDPVGPANAGLYLGCKPA
jgi:SAM-dependent methyltransferase